ncbi:hypothetical protein ACFL47_03305 [Candidatus Latescibacterota bacterium]
MKTIAYKKNTDETIERLCLLYLRRAQNQIFARFDVPNKTIGKFREENPEGFCDYPDPHERITFWDACLKERMDVEDDSIPSAYLSEFDQALYGALVGGEAQFMSHDNGWISSMVSPILKDWTDFDALYLGENHIWHQRYLDQLECFASGSKDKFGISHFILIDGLNFAFELVGATKTYESLIDSQDMIKRTIDFAYDLNVRVQETFFDNTPTFRDGTFSNMVQWVPGRIVSESLDPFHMTSVDYFEEWGRENVERMFGHFDGGVVHLHGNGRHLLEATCTIKGLKAIWLGDDIGFPQAFDVLNDLRKRADDMPLVTSVEFDDFAKRLAMHDLPGGVLYQVSGCPDADTANRYMDQVRGYRI